MSHVLSSRAPRERSDAAAVAEPPTAVAPPGPCAPRLAASVPVLESRHPSTEFRELFGTAPSDVLRAMEEADDDVAAHAPALGGSIRSVGLTRQHVPVVLRSPFVATETVAATCTVRVCGGVPATRRGLHLSRIGHALAESIGETHDDVASYALWLAQAVASSQYGRATVEVDAIVPYVEDARTIGRRPKWSLESLRLVGRARVTPTRAVTDAGIRVSHIVACPCVQQTYKHALRAASGEAPSIPLLTHSQRCRTTVTVRNLRQPFVVRDALAVLDATLVRTCNTLPRDRELACVYRAHQSPQFIEDCVRGAVLQIAGLWAADAFDSVEGRSRSVESIHEYDLIATMTLRSPSRGGESDERRRPTRGRVPPRRP